MVSGSQCDKMFFNMLQSFYTCMAEKVDWESLSLQYDKMGERPWRYLTVVIKKWEKEVGAVLESFETTRIQVEFLMCITKFTKEGRTITQKDVAKALGRAENTASGVFRGLEKKGYIVRSSSEDDLRAKHIVITEKGLLLVEKALSEIITVDERLFPDARDNEELIRLLKKYF
jgi:DNA-binding MarR family transcriptional regulator